jgi:hypothetical protein
MGCAPKVVSFTPGFCPVPKMVQQRKPFQRFLFVSLWKPLKRFPNNVSSLSTGLKPGENEKDFEAKLRT